MLVSECWDVMPLLDRITETFQKKIIPLYTEEDYDRGYIVSKNRRGDVEKFPVATLSIAVVSNEKQSRLTLKDFDDRLVKAKKGSKAIVGNSYVFQ